MTTMPPAMQHTRCLLALTLTHATMGVLTPGFDPTPLKANTVRYRWLRAGRMMNMNCVNEVKNA